MIVPPSLELNVSPRESDHLSLPVFVGFDLLVKVSAGMLLAVGMYPSLNSASARYNRITEPACKRLSAMVNMLVTVPALSCSFL